jgi:hypothetical protein
VMDDCLYLFTRYSAIPLADAVRGLHDQLGLAEPKVNTIDVHPKRASYFQTNKQLIEPDREEADRLAGLIEGANNVVIFDEFVALAKTIRLAGEIVDYAIRSINAPASCYAVLGKWYADIRPIDTRHEDAEDFIARHVDVEAVTVPDCAAIMYDIGLKAGEIMLANS